MDSGQWTVDSGQWMHGKLFHNLLAVHCPLDPKDMPHFQTTRRVEFCETDLAGIVHFANYYRYMEQAEHEFFRSLGLKIHGRFPDGSTYGWPRVAASASFSAPAYYDDEIDVRLTILKRTHRSLTISYEFWRGVVRLATGEMKTAFCHVVSPGKLTSVDMPHEITSVLDAAMARP